MFLQSLLFKPDPDPADVSYLIDHIMLDVLMNKFVQVYEGSLEYPCIPLHCYRKILFQHALVDTTLNELCEENESKS